MRPSPTDDTHHAAEIKSDGRTVFKNQVVTYIRKYARVFMNSGSWINIIIAIAIAIIVVNVTGAETFKEYGVTRTSAFVLVCACIWVGLFNSIQTICQERDIIRQEHFSGISYNVFLCAHLVVDFVVSLTQTLIFIVAVLIRYHGQMSVSGVKVFNVKAVISLFITFLLITFAADVLGLMISSIVKTAAQASIVMPFVLILQFIISGFIFELKGIFKIISNITIAKWGMQAVCIALDVNTLSTDVEKISNLNKSQMETINRYLEAQKADHILEYNPGGFHFFRTILILVLFIALEFLVTMVAMRLIDKDGR